MFTNVKRKNVLFVRFTKNRIVKISVPLQVRCKSDVCPYQLRILPLRYIREVHGRYIVGTHETMLQSEFQNI